ncbi:MAG TPA: hypothetical protein VHU84_19720 [Lacipirellulaceae bacterium]|jgi:hypothetical protein|nr:hypothetical protein [Lacipirellulaceae bacterium]
MKRISTMMKPALVALALVAPASLAHAGTVPVTGWIVHNGTSTVGGTAAAPTFTAGDNITVMAPFSDVTLANDGDFVEATTTLTMNTRTGTGINTLNTQLRLGIFDDSVNGTVTAGDIPNIGFIIQYSNLAAGGPIAEQQSLTQTSPFTSPVTIGAGVQDSGGDSIQGANPGPVTFTMRLTRNAGKIDLTGSISGTDSVSTNPYLSTFAVSGYSSTNFPANGSFTFNRIGLFMGDNVNAASASLANSSVTTNDVVPEPTSLMLVIGIAAGGVLLPKRRQHASRC